MRHQKGLTVFEALSISAILIIAAIVLYPIIRSGSRATDAATYTIVREAAQAPSDRLPMLAYIESAAAGEFFLFRRFHLGALMQSYLEELGVYARRDAKAYKDPFEGVYLWAMQPNTGSEFLNPQGDPYRMPRSAEESLALFENSEFGYGIEEPGTGNPFAGQPGSMSQPGTIPPGTPGMPQPGAGIGDPRSQPPLGGNLGSPTMSGYPLGETGLDF